MEEMSVSLNLGFYSILRVFYIKNMLKEWEQMNVYFLIYLFSKDLKKFT